MRAAGCAQRCLRRRTQFANCNSRIHQLFCGNIWPHGSYIERPATPAAPVTTFQPYIRATESPAEFTVKAVVLGVLFGLLFGASTVYLGLQSRPDGQRVDSHRGAGDLGAEAVRRVDDSREQHRADDRLGRRVARRRRRVHHPGADLPRPVRARVLQLPPDHAARDRRRHPRRADDGAAAARAHRQGTRRASLSGRHRVRRRAGRRRARRRARAHGVHGAGNRGRLEIAVVDLPDLPHRNRLHGGADGRVPERNPQPRSVAGIHGRRLRDRPANRGRDVCGRRAVVAGAAAAALDPRQLHDRPVSAGARERPADRPDVGAPVVERVHPVHRRRRGACRGAHHTGAHSPDDRGLVPRKRQRVRRRGGGPGRPAAHRPRHAADCSSSSDRCCSRCSSR